MKTALILGATGQVGQSLLAQALANPQISRVVAPSRRPLPTHPKLDNPIVDFEALPADAYWWRADFICCALGTTLRQAKSKAGFYRVDHDYVLTAAQMARQAGTPVFGLVSSLGASSKSRVFYLRTKGETERDLCNLDFAALVLIRPALLIGGPRSQNRPLESFGLFLGKHLSSLLPRRYHAVSTESVARSLLGACLEPEPGIRIIESELIGD